MDISGWAESGLRCTGLDVSSCPTRGGAWGAQYESGWAGAWDGCCYKRGWPCTLGGRDDVGCTSQGNQWEGGGTFPGQWEAQAGSTRLQGVYACRAAAETCPPPIPSTPPPACPLVQVRKRRHAPNCTNMLTFSHSLTRTQTHTHLGPWAVCDGVTHADAAGGQLLACAAAG